MQQYLIRDRYLLEKILNYEIPKRLSVDSSEQVFNYLFVGEKSLKEQNKMSDDCFVLQKRSRENIYTDSILW